MSHLTDQSEPIPEPSLVLAIDIGTSGVRGSLYDDEGREVEGTTVRNASDLLNTFGSGAVVDPNEIIEQIVGTIDEVLAASVGASRIEIVAVSCFWHSLVGLDHDGNPVTPLFGWADTQAAGVVDDLRKSFNEQVTHARTGCRFHSSYWPAKLLWLRQQNPNEFQKTHHWVSLSEVLTQRLLGKAAISISMASGTGLLDQENCTWDGPLISFLGIDVNHLPRIADDGEFFSGLISGYADRWPQLQKARWFPAIGDGAANSIGVGCVSREKAALMIGTSGAMRVMWRGDIPESLPPELWCYRADSERVIVGGALSDGGGLFAWMKGALNFECSNEEIERELGSMQPDVHGLTVLPFWSGERSTGWHTSARGTIVGLTQHTKPIEILRASMEAIAYRFALITASLDQVASETAIVASGNALASSPVWTQILADVLCRPITISDVREASNRGAVLLALEMEGRIRDIADAPVPLGRTYEPDMTRHARYRQGIERQEKLYRQLIT